MSHKWPLLVTQGLKLFIYILSFPRLATDLLTYQDQDCQNQICEFSLNCG